jgi:Domain of unknown function (DUF4150)/GHH signature containing HNH/Endo VII superfamily nuclease toxin  2
MSNQVYANNMEIACKAGDGKSICAMPDVCMTPPQTPATPPGVPIPYPNTGMDSDCADGSSTVEISGQPIMLKNKSYFKKSTGDEAGCAPMKGVITSTNTGKVYFNAWSMDVLVEGENVVRNLDLTTHNHASFPGNSPTWPFIDAVAAASDPSHPCHKVAEALINDCAGCAAPFVKKGELPASKRKKAIGAMCGNKKCKKALKCVLTKKSPNNCCPDENGDQPTPHHIVPASQFTNEAGGVLKLGAGKKYSYRAAPCVCAQGNSHSTGLHGEIHTETNNLTLNHQSIPASNISASGKSFVGKPRWSVGDAEDVGAKATAKETKCDEDCIKAQVRQGHQNMKIDEGTQIRPTTAGEVTEPRITQPRYRG